METNKIKKCIKMIIKISILLVFLLKNSQMVLAVDSPVPTQNTEHSEKVEFSQLSDQADQYVSNDDTSDRDTRVMATKPDVLGNSDETSMLGNNNGGWYDIKNSLLILSKPNISSFNVTVQGTTAYSTGTVAKNAPVEQEGFGQTFTKGTYKTKLPNSFGSGYSAKYVMFNDATVNKGRVIAKFGNVGYYFEDPNDSQTQIPIDMQVEYYDIKHNSAEKVNNVNGTEKQTLFVISENPWQGYNYYNGSNFKVKITFYKAKTNTAISLNTSSYLTFNSLNGLNEVKEYVSYENTIAKTLKTAVTKDTIVKYFPVMDPTNYAKPAYGGNLGSFDDFSTGKTFTRGSVSMMIEGNSNIFSIGKYNIAGVDWGASAWNTFATTAIYRQKPRNPYKKVFNSAGTTEIDGQAVAQGATIKYRIYQPVSILYTEIRDKWKSFSLTDTLPAGLTYQSADVYDRTGKKLSAAASGVVTNNSNKVTFTANSSFLNNALTYSEEEFFYLEIIAKVNDGLVNGTVLKNQATTKVENYSSQTNIVTNTVAPIVPKIEKTVKNITENAPATHGANADFKYGDELEFKVVMTSPNGAIKNATITDQMPTGLTITSWSLNGVNKAMTGVTGNKLTNLYAATHARGATHTVLIRAKAATSGLTNVQKLTNTATLSSTGNSNVAASATATHYLPTHKITKAANNAGGTAVGTTASKLSWNTDFFYDITYTNTSTKGVTNPTITDTLPVGINATSQNVQYKLNGATAWTNHTGNLVSANGRTLNTGSAFTGVQLGKTLIIRIPVKATSAAAVQGKSLTNTANATAKYSLLAATTTKTNVANVSGSVVVNYGIPNLTVTKQVRNNTEKIPTTGYAGSTDIKFGDEVEYEIKIMNTNGAAQAQTPVFTDVLPKGLTLTNWTYQAGSGTVVDKKLTDWNGTTNTLTTKYATNHNTNTLVTIKIKAKVAASGLTNSQTLTNTATISASGVAAKSATANTVHYLPSHKITKAANNVGGTAVGTTASKLSWQTGFFYDITYTNTSTKGFTNPTITDTLPVGIDATSQNVQYKLNGATAWTNHTGNLVSANGRTVNTAGAFTGVQPGKTLVVRIPVKATSAAAVQGKSFTNTVNVTAKYSLLAATATKTNVANVSGAVIVNYGMPNLTITKQVRNNTEKIPTTGYAASTDIKFGDDVEYEIKITNANGAGQASAPEFKDILPKGLTLTKWTYQVGTGAVIDKGTTGWVASTNTLTSKYEATHNPNTVVTIKIIAKSATSGLTNGQTLTNTATVSATGVTAQSATANAVHYLPTHKITKVANDVNGKVVGTATSKLDWPTTFYYDVTYTNTATKGVINPTIIDTLPTGIFATGQNVQFKIDNAATWTNDTNKLISADFTKLNTGTRFTGFNPGQTLTIRIPVKGKDAGTTQGKSFVNTAEVTGKYSLLNPTVAKNDVAKVTGNTTVQYLVPNMSITKKVRNVTEKIPATGYASAVNLKPGDQLEYEITITNATGAGTAYGPKFEDVLPQGMTFNKWLYNGADKGVTGWNSSTNTLSDTYVGATGNHTPGRTVTILVQATAGKTLTDKQVLKNIASVSGSGVTKKEAEASVTNYLPNHTLTKEVSQKIIHQGEEFDYLLTYDNQSSLATSYISPVVTDKLPETVTAKANTTKYSIDNGLTYKNLNDSVWSSNWTKLDTTGHLNITIQSGKKLLIKFTVTSSAKEEKKLTNTAFVNGKFGLSNQTTNYPAKEEKSSVDVELKNRQFYLNVRQVILKESPELVKPLNGYTTIQHQEDKITASSKNHAQVTMPSTIKDAAVQQSDFKRIELKVEQTAQWIKVLPIVPEYYQYVGEVQSTKTENLATDHLSSKLLKQDILLDYTKEEEYWVTIYLTPKFAENEETPRPYSWSSTLNNFGTIKK